MPSRHDKRPEAPTFPRVRHTPEMRARWDALPYALRRDARTHPWIQAAIRPHVVDGVPLESLYGEIYDGYLMTLPELGAVDALDRSPRASRDWIFLSHGYLLGRVEAWRTRWRR